MLIDLFVSQEECSSEIILIVACLCVRLIRRYRLLSFSPFPSDLPNHSWQSQRPCLLRPNDMEALLSFSDPVFISSRRFLAGNHTFRVHKNYYPSNRMNKALYQKSRSHCYRTRAPIEPHWCSSMTELVWRSRTNVSRIWIDASGVFADPRFASSEFRDGLLQMAKSYSNLIFDEIDRPVILGGLSFKF